MKKIEGLAMILLLLVLIIGITGCGQPTSSSSTATTLANTGTIAGSAALIAGGVGSVASSFGGLGSSSTPTSLSVKTIDSGPPASFFTSLPADGYFDAPPRSGGNETVKMMMLTLNGSEVTPAWLAAHCGLGQLTDGTTVYSWASLTIEAGGGGISQSAWQAITQYQAVHDQTYTAPTTLWEYIAWSEIGPSMTAMNQAHYPLFPPYSKIDGSGLTSAEAKTKYAMGGMKGYVDISETSFSMHMGITLTMTLDATVNHPVPYHMTGSGTITMGSKTGTIAMDQYLNSSGAAISGSMTVVTDDGYTMTLTFNADGTMSGTLKETSTGNQVGTIIIYATGGGEITLNDGTKQTFSAPSG